MRLPQKRGFTLIELLVVISIIAVLSVMGMAVFSGLQKGARDTRRKGDIDAIAKAYEVQRTSSYIPLLDANFSSGAKPKDPNNTKGEYFNWLAADGSGFKACASLEDNPATACNTPATNCYCKVSTQGTINTSSSVNNTASTRFDLGLGGSSSSSCDTNGTLLSGLVGYWKFDDQPQGISVADWTGANIGTWNGTGSHWSAGQTGFGNAGSFNGVDDYVSLGAGKFDNLTNATISFWFNYTGSFTSNNLLFNRHINTAADSRQPIFISYSGGYGNKLVFENVVNGSYRVVYSNNNITAGWHHAAIVCGSGGERMYLDGTLQTLTNPTTDCLSAIATTSFTNIGGGSGTSFAGQIDDFRIYNRVLSGGSPNSDISLLAGGCLP
ncbi:prepilin-type N-terminal cleavage/methylation domain-containing protein [Patescibacteria group bacterium]|nr:prepilin-type N-terminal cleavage/methylation domain-containing protein [Patescibacteria group bacterium]